MLSPKEKETVQLLADDKSAKEISAIRKCSLHTVNAQIRTAKIKYGVGTDHGLTAKYVRMTTALLIAALLTFSVLHVTGCQPMYAMSNETHNER